MTKQGGVRPDRTEAIMKATLDLAREVGYAKLSIEAVATRAGVGKHTVYRRWPSKGLLFHDSLMALNDPATVRPDTGDIKEDLRQILHSTVDLMASPEWGPLYRALLGEAQQDPAVAASLKERFLDPATERMRTRVEAARRHGQIDAGFDADLAMELLAGPMYYRYLVSQEPLTYERFDRILDIVFEGLAP